MAGFNLDFEDDVDLDEMIALASRGEENEDGDDSVLRFDDDGNLIEDDNFSENSVSEPAHEETYEEDTSGLVEETPEYEDVAENTVGSDYSEPEVEEPPALPTPSYSSEPDSVSHTESRRERRADLRRQTVSHAASPSEKQVSNDSQASGSTSSFKATIRKESDQIQEASNIIRTLDSFRSLNEQEKIVAMQLVLNEQEVDPRNEADFIVKVLNADAMMGKTMRNLREAASQRDRVQRAFMILRLPHNEIESLGDLVMMLSDHDLGSPHDSITFAQNIENAIQDMDHAIVQYIAATESVLNAKNA